MYAAYLPVAWRPEKPYYGCLNDLIFSKLHTLTVNVFGMGTLDAPDYAHNARNGPLRSHFVTGNCPVLSRLILTAYPESKDVCKIPARSQWITSLRILVSKAKALETLEILQSISMEPETICLLVKDAENLKCVKHGDKTWRSENSKLLSEAMRGA
ncbi:hypothetical protein N7528_003485 [Penicillium herquei]|nr:hypothetical protein N7528_003485 [Penicillium herquei]